MKFVLLFLALLPSRAYAECNKQLRVAIIDTGFGYNNLGYGANLCDSGHKDFTDDGWLIGNSHTGKYIPLDLIGHGTNVVGIIDNYAKQYDVSYCIIVLRYFSKNQSGKENLKASIQAIKYATELKVDFINYSGGGIDPSSEEKSAVKEFLNGGGKFIAAAGNLGKKLGSETTFYPAMYDQRIVVVGNLDKNGKRAKSSNYGKYVNRWEKGEEVTAYDITLSGTSQATALVTAKILSKNKNKCELIKNSLHKK